jgi:polygalacturonase
MRFVGFLLFLITPQIWALNVNVQSYGAKPDGITDDTAALVKASTAVAAAGGQLYFPPGTYLIDPTKGHIVLGSNMTIYGSGTIRVKPRVGNFEYIVGPTPSYRAISNVTIKGITIDENVLNNPSTVLAKQGQIQNIVEAYALDGLTISNAKFYLSGVYAVFIKDHLTMNANQIIFEKRNDNAWYDNSAVYLATDKSTCAFTGNRFSTITSGANTAIEVHTTQNCQISGNTFDNYATAVLPLDSYALSITNNQITRAENAISLWSVNGAQNVSIQKNSISLNNRDRQSNAAGGILLYWCTSCNVTGSYYNLNIEDNTISFQPEKRTNLDPYSYWGIGLQPAGNVDSVTISGNTITNAPVRGIKIGNALAPNRESNLLIENNTLVNPGNNTSEWWYEAGIAMDGKLANVTVRGNVIDNTASPFVGHYGLWSSDTGVYSSVIVQGNTIDTAYTQQLVPNIVH